MKTLPIILSALLLVHLPSAMAGTPQQDIDTAFRCAVNAHDSATVKKMLRAGQGKPSLDAVRQNLYGLIREGDTETVRLLLENGWDINARINDFSGMSALGIAAGFKGNAEMLRFLLAEGADVNVGNIRRDSALFRGIQSGDMEMVRILVEAGASMAPTPELTWRTSIDVLAAAAATGDVGMLDYLLEHGAEFHPDCYGVNMLPPVLMAATSGNPAMVERLLELGMNVNTQGSAFKIIPTDAANETVTPLMAAAHCGDPAMVRLLLEKGAAPGKRSGLGHTALMAAAFPPLRYWDECRVQHKIRPIGDRVGCIHLLLQAGVDVDDACDSGKTALFTSVEMDSPDVLETLLAAGASVDKASNEGVTPLMNAARWGNAGAVGLLLAAGADARARDLHGRTVLWHAAFGGNSSVVEQLLAAGADLDATDYLKQTPLMVAADNQRGAVVAILAGKCKDVDATDAFGRSALHHAAQHNAQKSVQILLDAGADAALKDRAGKTPDAYDTSSAGTISTLIKSHQH